MAQGLGALVEGFQGGYEFTQSAKRRRQFEKLTDQAIESGEYDMSNRRDLRKRAGRDVWGGAMGDDPFQSLLRRGWEGLRGAFGGGQEQALPLGEEMVEPEGFAPYEGFAEGGKVEADKAFREQMRAGGMRGLPEYPDETARRLAKNKPGKSMDDEVRARRATRPQGPRQPAARPAPVEGDPSKYAPAQKGQVGNAPRAAGRAGAQAIPTEPPGRMRRAGSSLARGAAGGAALGATVGATRAYGRDTMDMADEIGIPKSALGSVKPQASQSDVSGLPDSQRWDSLRASGQKSAMGALTDPSFYKDLGVRAIGTAGEIGRAITGGLAGRDPGETALPAGTPGQAAAAPPRTQAAAEAPPKPRTGIPPVQQKEQAVAPQQPAAEEFIDPRELELESIPDMDVQNWVEFRKNMRQDMSGSGRLEDLQAADAYVDNMQYKGFQHYGNFALQLLQNGDEQGAAKAMMMAYQYFPNGTNLRFGVHNGRLVATGVDPKTGQAKGAQVLDAKMLSDQLANFQKPENFKVWTLDWRAAELNERAEDRLGEQAEVDATYKDRAGRAALQNAANSGVSAQADLARANAMGGALGGLKPDTMGSAEDTFVQAVQQAGFDDESLMDPSVQQQLVGLMSMAYHFKNGQTPPQVIAAAILAMSPEERAQIQAELTGQ